jgi:hypothetical protein
MRKGLRRWLPVLAAATIGTCTAAPAAQASFGVTQPNWEAGTCNARNCEYSNPPSAFYTQAAGHPEWGITSFELNHTGSGGSRTPEGALKRIRVDVPPGLAANPQAPEKCAKAQFEADPNGCPAGSLVGETELEAVVEVLGLPVVAPSSGKVYNLEQPVGLPLDFGINVEPAGPIVAPTHLFLEGHLSDAYEPSLAARGIASGDYHEYFEINNVPTEATVTGLVKSPLKVLKSKLLFKGRAGGDFLTLPSVCSPSTTSYLEVESYEGAVSSTPTVTPVGVEGCGAVPFRPTVSLTPETAHLDAPDGATVAINAQQFAGPGEINTADIRDAHIVLPEGMTLNPAAAPGLATCSPAQFSAGQCPSVSGAKLGTVTIETPDLPPGSVTGGLYLGNPAGGPITGPPFTVYLDAESPRYGVFVRLQGQSTPDPTTGRLETTFLGNPQLPFSSLIVHLNGGPGAPLANPLTCATGHTEGLFVPYTGLAPFASSSPFAPEGAGGGACPGSIPFSLAQSTSGSSTRAGAYTSYVFNLARGDGQQYLSKLSTVLPPGLVGAIPSVTLCAEPAAAAGSCGAGSLLGTANVTVGAGSAPTAFSGPVYITGPYAGAPYGLSIPIEAASGPFDLGRAVTRASIGVDPHSGRVVVTSSPTTIVKGVPLRLKTLSVAVSRASFLFNPSNCGRLETNSTLTSTYGATQILPSPFQVSGCGALPFKPTFKASTSTRTSRAIGASLRVSMTQGAHESNLRSVVTQLPLQLPSRLTTLQKACPEATYAANPRSCPEGSMVGSATVHTPVLPASLSGPAYLVSHGGAAFPDLDLLLEGGGVKVILEGNTNIKNGITTSTFASIPDVPVSSFSLELPTGPHSALAAYGNLCAAPLTMPTVLTAQSGAQIKQNTPIEVSGCLLRILRVRLVHRSVLVTVRALAAGRISAGGRNLRSVRKRIRRPTTTTLKLALSHSAMRALRRHHRTKLAVKVTLVPKQRSLETATASATLTAR